MPRNRTSGTDAAPAHLPPRFLGAVLAFGIISCGGEPAEFPDRPEGTLLVRIEIEDPGAVRASYRVWDERHELVRDVVLPIEEFPRVVALAPDVSDPTDEGYRGALLEVETWTEDGCNRGRESLGLRYGVSEVEHTLIVGEPPSFDACTPIYVERGATGESCTESDPCGTLEAGVELAIAATRRFVMHIAGGHDYAQFDPGTPLRTSGMPSVVRAWPGRSLPSPPNLFAREGDPCDVDNEDACARNSICIDGRCAEQSAINLCCNFNDSGSSGIEIDGLTVRRGKYAIELNGTPDVTIRHCIVEDAGGATPERPEFLNGGLPSAGVRVFESPRARLEHNLIRRSRDASGRSFRPAVGVLVDGFTEGERVPAAILERNRVESSESYGLLAVTAAGPLVLRGNSWCRNGAGGYRMLIQGMDVDASGELFAENGGPDITVDPEWGGSVSLTEITSASAQPLQLGTATLEQSVVQGMTEGPGDNLFAPDPAPDVRDCLSGESQLGYGVCSLFPFCE